MSAPALVLLVEDDASLLEVMTFQLRAAGHAVQAFGSGAAAMAWLAGSHTPDLLITDLKMPGMGGFELLKAAHLRFPQLPVLLVTAFGSVEVAVEAMRRGAFDFVTKPFHKDQFLLTVEKALEHARLTAENQRLRDDSHAAQEIIALSPAMRELMTQARQVAQTSATVLLLGESGAGKEVVAKEIHRASDRASRPFVAINCAAIPKDLLEAELFGFAKGAFTGAHKDRIGKFVAAEGGTLFLDEIGDLDEVLQSKLLRVLEERQVDVVGGGAVPVNVRVVAATHRDLSVDVKERRFRQDLYFRLAVVPLRIPPLRARPEDAMALFRMFVRRFGAGKVEISDSLLNAVAHRPWPGNVREVRNVAERMVTLRRADLLDVQDLPPEDAPGMLETATLQLSLDNLSLPPEGVSLEALERAIVVHALNRNGGNIAAAARFLRIPRHVLVYRLEKFDIQRDAHGAFK